MRTILLSTKGEFKGYYIMGKPIPLGEFAVCLSESDIQRLGTGAGYWNFINQCVIARNEQTRSVVEMTPTHEDHLQSIKDAFMADVDKKYRAGVAQHGGKLWEKPGLIEKAMEECIDQFVFLFTLQMQRDNPSMVDPKARDIDE